MKAKTKGLILTLVIIGIFVSIVSATQVFALSNQRTYNQSLNAKQECQRMNEQSDQIRYFCCHNGNMYRNQHINQTMEMYQQKEQQRSCMNRSK